MAEVRGHETLLRRLRGMGISLEPLPGGRTATGALRLRGGPFPTASGAQRVPHVRLLTVGASHVKCVEPDWLFPLPLIHVLDCDDTDAIEARIRGAWAARRDAIRRAGSELAHAGILSEPEAGGAVLAFPLSLPHPLARGRALQPGSVILPSVGPLSRLPLRRAKDRVFRFQRSPTSGIELEIEITGRIDQLARVEGRVAERQRSRRAELSLLAAEPLPERAPRLLLIGAGLAADRRFTEGLRVRGFEVVTATTPGAALRAFAQHSFELAMVDARLGREEGVELIPTLQALPGVENLPIVLVDDRVREARREAARQAGARAYLARPLELPRLVGGLERLLHSPARRRFSRYPQRLAVREAKSGVRSHTVALGRLGMMLCTEANPDLGSLARYEIALPELGATVRVDAEALYERPGPIGAAPDVGLRFHGFAGTSEELLIRYLGLLEDRAA